MGSLEPLHRLSDLPAGNAGRSAVLPAHRPEDLRRSSGPGAAVRHEPEQSQPVDPCPAAGLARGTPRPRRCPRPLPHGSGAPVGCLGGAARGRATGGACALPSLRTQSWAGLPPFAHDGTERRIVRPQDPAEQTDCYSGKKKDHTVKNILLVNALLIILFLSDTVSLTGRKPAVAGSRLPGLHPSPGGDPHADQETTNCHGRSKEPTRRSTPAGCGLSMSTAASSVAASSKTPVEAGRSGCRDGNLLHNFRVRLTPWQPPDHRRQDQPTGIVGQYDRASVAVDRDFRIGRTKVDAYDDLVHAVHPSSRVFLFTATCSRRRRQLSATRLPTGSRRGPPA